MAVEQQVKSLPGGVSFIPLEAIPTLGGHLAVDPEPFPLNRDDYEKNEFYAIAFGLGGVHPVRRAFSVEELARRFQDKPRQALVELPGDLLELSRERLYQTVGRFNHPTRMAMVHNVLTVATTALPR